MGPLVCDGGDCWIVGSMGWDGGGRGLNGIGWERGLGGQVNGRYAVGGCWFEGKRAVDVVARVISGYSHVVGASDWKLAFDS